MRARTITPRRRTGPCVAPSDVTPLLTGAAAVFQSMYGTVFGYPILVRNDAITIDLECATFRLAFDATTIRATFHDPDGRRLTAVRTHPAPSLSAAHTARTLYTLALAALERARVPWRTLALPFPIA